MLCASGLALMVSVRRTIDSLNSDVADTETYFADLDFIVMEQRPETYEASNCEAMPAPCAITVRKFESTEFAAYRNLRLSALEESPDAFESTLGAEQLRIQRAWGSRLDSGCRSGMDLPLIGLVGASAAGLAWGKVDSSDSTVVNVYQMWVAPECRGHGLARFLLRTIVVWAASLQARSVQLGVVCGNSPAMRLYTSEGFVPIGQVTPLRPGSMLMVQHMRLHIPQHSV